MAREVDVSKRRRYALIDVTRGVAILLMFVYHFSWDLTAFGFAQFHIFTNPLWIWFANLIAALILLVMGVSQVMARQRGLSPRMFFRRLLIIAAGAGAVSLATYQMDPVTFIFFGILHHVALASLILVAAIQLPTWAMALLAALFFVAPEVLSGPAFSTEWLLWVGLSPSPPLTLDYVPLAPWFGLPLSGVVLGRLMLGGGTVPALLMWRPVNPMARLVRLIGRHSLILYIVHQPILYGGLYLLVSVFDAGR